MKLIKLLFASTFLFFATALHAEPAEVLRIDETVWLGFDAGGNIVLNYIGYHKVITNSDTGEIVYSVHGQIAEGSVLPPKGAMHFETGYLGFICTGDAPYFKYVLTPKGKTSFKCQNWPFDD